jgi:hypothetical protein
LRERKKEREKERNKQTNKKERKKVCIYVRKRFRNKKLQILKTLQKAGKPKLRWLDCSDNDLTSMGVKRLKKTAEDRSAWDIILNELIPMKRKKSVSGGSGSSDTM